MVATGASELETVDVSHSDYPLPFHFELDHVQNELRQILVLVGPAPYDKGEIGLPPDCTTGTLRNCTREK